jgi:hypothetical protein
MLQFRELGIVLVAVEGMGEFTRFLDPSAAQKKLGALRANNPGGKTKTSGPPTLPVGDTLYGAAKHLEFSGDLRGALALYVEALCYGDRPDSALKDISNIYVMFGKIAEAEEFLVANECYVTNRKGYQNLLGKLRMELRHQQDEQEQEFIMPRVLLLEVVDEPVRMELCARIFPNPGKIRRILRIDERTALVQFSTYSSARKALQSRKIGEGVAITWAETSDQALMMELQNAEVVLQDPRCLAARTMDRLPDPLAAFPDDFVSVFEVSDPVVIALAEKVETHVSGLEQLRTPSTYAPPGLDENDFYGDARSDSCAQM